MVFYPIKQVSNEQYKILNESSILIVISGTCSTYFQR